jgi:hypothetical protein
VWLDLVVPVHLFVGGTELLIPLLVMDAEEALGLAVRLRMANTGEDIPYLISDRG